jgi:hypothetical protein
LDFNSAALTVAVIAKSDIKKHNPKAVRRVVLFTFNSFWVNNINIEKTYPGRGLLYDDILRSMQRIRRWTGLIDDK